MTYSDLTALARPSCSTPTDSCDICQGTGWVTVLEECIIPGGALCEEEARCECNRVPSDNLDDYVPF